MRSSIKPSQSKPIIECIPIFLEYCQKEKNLLPKSIENYYRFLNRFVAYLRYSGKDKLLPHQLSPEHIEDYKAYLSEITNPTTKQPISKVTQNLYLIGLRTLLSYFSEKNIPSLLPDKIKLLKQDKPRPENILLNSEQLKKLLSAPNTSTHNGLRDRVILEILLSTGLKINQIVTLNKNDVEFRPRNFEIKILDKKGIYYRIVSLSESATYWLKGYLNTRQDKERPLFINYQGRKNSPRRLTDRSIERNIKKYIADNNLPPTLTPETLRDVYIFHLLNRDIKITSSLTHRVFTVRDYNIKLPTISCYNNKEKNKFSNWHVVENVLSKEIRWLKWKITIMPSRYRSDRFSQNCDDCLFRKLAILIVSGKVIVTEFKAKNRKDLWNSITKQEELLDISRHGKEWHWKMMDVISSYFRARNYKVTLEPTLNYGRADLGIYPNPKEAIYIEVGTVSLFKLWYNLSTMRDITFLLVPSEEYAIEFKA